MEFFSSSRFSWLFRVKASIDNNRVIKSKIRLFGFVRFTVILFKGKKISCKAIIQLLQKYSQAVIIFDHRMGGGSNFYLDEHIAEFKKDGKVIFLTYFRENIYFIDIIYKEKTEHYFTHKLSQMNFIYDLFKTELFLNSLVSFAHFYDIISYIKSISPKLTKITIPIHDYFFICPSINLLYKNQKYCNIPTNQKICNECFQWHKFDIEFKNIVDFRQMWQSLFDISDHMLVFSNSSKEIINKVYKVNDNKYNLVPHRVTWIKRQCKEAIKKEYLNIGILGHLCLHKGLNVIESLLEKSLKLPWKFYLFGSFYSDKNYTNLTLCGIYKRENLVEIVEKYDIDIFIIPSICPETFSYATEEIILMDKPIICFNLGAQAERVKQYHKGYIAKAISAQGIKEQLVNFIKDSCPTKY